VLFNQDAAMTLEEVSAILGVTRQRVAQIERVAFRKLRVALKERGFTVDDLYWKDRPPIDRRGLDS
jgi:DNA-directed RNA polymerase sigma subunit (sigma70/sigma32)